MKIHCRRYTVSAMGVDEVGNVVKTINGDENHFCTGEPGNCGCPHAEENLLKIMKNPVTVIVSHSPCINCARLLYEAGVKTVVYLQPYRLSDGIEYLINKGVNISMYESV